MSLYVYVVQVWIVHASQTILDGTLITGAALEL